MVGGRGTIKYSILIPVYNTGKFLRQCLDSLLAQKIIDFEVIIVNDGSTDNSFEICQEYSRKFANFVLISQENKGLLLTRRIAIQRSSGKYLLFLDSDDFWESNTLEIIDKTLNNYNFPDIVTFNFNKVDESGKIFTKISRSLPYGQTISRGNYGNTIYKLLVSSDDLNSLWSKVVKREIVDIEADYSNYAHVSLGEDLLQSIPLILNSKNIVFIDSYLYNYRSNSQSITNNFNLKSWNNFVFVRKEIFSKLKAQNDFSDSLIDLYFQRNLEKFLSIVNLISVSNLKYGNKKSLLHFINQDSFVQETLFNLKNRKLKTKSCGKRFILWLCKKKIMWLVIIILNTRFKILRKV